MEIVKQQSKAHEIKISSGNEVAKLVQIKARSKINENIMYCWPQLGRTSHAHFWDLLSSLGRTKGCRIKYKKCGNSAEIYSLNSNIPRDLFHSELGNSNW